MIAMRPPRTPRRSSRNTADAQPCTERPSESEERMMNRMETSREMTPDDVTVRIRTIRAKLPGQVRRERLETARAGYGPLYSMAEIRQKVAESLPPRLGFVRRAVLEPIETYVRTIPDSALLKYDEAE